MVDKETVDSLVKISGDAPGAVQVCLTRALGSLGRPEFNSYLLDLMKDEHPEVTREAIASAGKPAVFLVIVPLPQSR